jgi:outer membrane protein assembly factor BamA
VADFDQRLKEAGTDSAKIGKLLVKGERRVKRRQLALDKGNAIMRLGEPPVVYDTALTRRSVEQMSTYLHSQGFFRAQVYATDTARTKRGLWRGFLYLTGLRKSRPRLDSTGKVRPHRRVTVIYHLREGRPFVLRNLSYTIADSAVRQIVLHDTANSQVRENHRYNEDLIGQERSRLEALLKNSGYYDFRQQYITLEADTSFVPFTVRLRTIIANPGPGQGHRRYTLRQVRMVTDAGVGRTLRAATGDTLRRAGIPGLRPRPRLGVRPDTTVTDSVHFAAYKQKFSTRLLARKLTLRPGQPYSLLRTQQTQHLLSDLDMFRFNTVSYRKVPDPPEADSSGIRPSSGQLDAIVNATPSPKFQETTEFGGTFVANLPGPFLNVRLKTRNPFGGAEVLELGVRAGLEGQFNQVGGVPVNSDYTVQFGATAALVLPQFLVPFRTDRFLTRYNPKTRFTLSETYVNRSIYTRTNFEFTFDYIWQKSAFHQFVFSPVVINVINTTRVSDDYRRRLFQLLAEQGSPLYRSFVELYEPSISFTSLYNSNDFNQTRDARYLRLSAEVGGLTRQLYSQAPWFNLDVYQFARFSADYRRYRHLTPQTYLVYRLNGGIVTSLAESEVTVTDINNVETKETQRAIPYDKYFFAGGSSSVRAWKPRRLGTGSSPTLLLSGDRDNLTEQPGELLLEGSVEYRFPVYSFVKGALFTDFGNVWSLQRTAPQAARFQPGTFLSELAVGSGLGIRFDFTFLILRLDVAAKVYDPTAPSGKEWAIRRLYKDSDHGATFNLGIGYPF